jgi:TonB-linked SusC/RagA family outer membrane protein
MMKDLIQRWMISRTMALLFTLLTIPLLLSAQSSKLTINIEQGTLKQILSQIEKQSTYTFLYVDSDLSNTKVNVNISGRDINETLSTILKGTNLNYHVDGKNINIFKNTTLKKTKGKVKRITGRVIDQTGGPLPGVSVFEEGNTGNGTITNIDGLYEINVSDDATIKLTYIGFKTHEELITGDKSVFDVALSEDVSTLDELVVVGYGQQRKISNVGAQSTIDIQDLKVPSSSLSTVLAGRISGVIAVQRTGEPGKDAADIWIRGIATPNSSTPLVLVDGVERSFNDIDPEDIESLTTLKDASATAVYGVRGANGVILIQTKPGIVGKPVVSVDYYEGLTQFTKSVDLANGLTYMNAVNEALGNNNQTPKYSQAYMDNTKNKVDPTLYPNVDWMKELFNNLGTNRRANVNIRGGSPNAKYYASVSYYNESGLMKTNNVEAYNSGMDYSRYNFTTNMNLKVTPTTTVDIGAQGYLGIGNYPAISASDVYSSAMGISPVDYPKMFYVNGQALVPGINPNGGSRNPYADATMRGYLSENTNQIYSNIRLTQDLSMLTKGLSITAMYAYDVYSYENVSESKRASTYYFTDRNNPYDANGQPILSQTFVGSDILNYGNSTNGNQNTYLESSLTYDRTFGKSRVSGLLLYNQQNKLNYPVSTLELSLPYRMQGLAGRATYSWDDRYFAEFNIGYNGSENFAPQNRYGTFPAVGLGWVVSNEKFWAPVSPVISFLKFRYTNGTIGNGGVSDRRFMYLAQYQYDSNYGYSFGSNNKTSGVSVLNDAVNVGWETSHKQDLGVDIKMFKNDLSVVFDLFKEHRTDILLSRSLSIPSFLGYQSNPYGNVGIVDNMGFDGTLEYTKRIDKNWKVTVRGNVTFSKNNWVKSDQPEQLYPWLDQAGNNINAIWGYKANGLYTQDDINKINAWDLLPVDQQAATKRPFPTQFGAVQAGDIKYKDLNGDGKIDAYDVTAIGNGDVPTMVYGFGFNAQYKSFSLGILFQGTQGADRLLSGSSIDPFMGDGGGGNLFSNIADRWNAANPSQNVFYPRLAYGSDKADNINNFQPSTWWVKNVDFLRLKTLQASYDLPKKLVNKLGVKNATIYVMGSNLLTFTSFKLWDPELNTSNGTSYPNSSTYTLGLNFSF